MYFGTLVQLCVCSCKCRCMHANLLVHVHVHVTLEWLLQLQRMGVYLVDSAEGPGGPRR